MVVGGIIVLVSFMIAPAVLPNFLLWRNYPRSMGVGLHVQDVEIRRKRNEREVYKGTVEGNV